MKLDWFAGLETKAEMNSIVIGEMEIIMGDLSTSADVKVLQVARSLDRLSKAWNAKKPLLQTGAEKEISQVDCTIDVSKVEPLLDRRMAEDILRREG